MEIQELWEKIQGEFSKVNTRLDNVEKEVGSMDTRLGKVETKVGSMDTRLGKVETKVGGMDTRLEKVETKVDNMDTRLGKVETEVKEVKYENKGIREELAKINERLDVIHRVDLVNILQKQTEIQKELNMNSLEHENFRYRHERAEKALGIA